MFRGHRFVIIFLVACDGILGGGDVCVFVVVAVVLCFVVSFQVKLTLDNLIEAQAGFADIGDSVTRVEHLLKEQKQLEEKGQVCTQ